MKSGEGAPLLPFDMSAATFALVFSGYWREVNIGGIPAKTGVYGVYVCRFDEEKKTVSLDDLIYIGQAINAKEEIAEHERWPDWQREVKNADQLLCFNFASVDVQTLDRVEAALIYQVQPVCNKHRKARFEFDPTTITVTGRVNKVPPHFTVPSAYPAPKF